MNEQLIQQIVKHVGGVNDAKVLQNPAVGKTGQQNELLMFIKPEVFLVVDEAKMAAAVKLVFEKIAKFNATVAGVVIVGGKALEEKEIMNRHYGYINLISRKASEQVNDEDRATMQDLLELASLDDHNIYGGHEFLKSHADFTPQTLEDLWATKKSLKLRSGFYLQSYQVGDEKFILINGFHPAQLAHFTETDRRIVLVLLHSDTDWGRLRNDMVGSTFPEKAAAGSIRGTFYANAAQYGFESVSIANNCVHLSAGPYEGAVEIMNFLGNLFDLNPAEQPPLMFQKLQAKGLSLDDAKKVLDNPDVVVDGNTDDLFTATEDVNSDDAVELWVNQ
jgi:hypothetical protein